MEYLFVLVAFFVAFNVLTMFLVMRCYKRATPELALVRSGAGGTKAVLNGGILVFPQLNDLTWVNMTAMRVDVMCCDQNALPFGDGAWQGRAEFVLRVARDEAAVLQAAAMWGGKTLAPLQLQPLLESRLLDALQQVAAQT